MPFFFAHLPYPLLSTPLIALAMTSIPGLY